MINKKFLDQIDTLVTEAHNLPPSRPGSSILAPEPFGSWRMRAAALVNAILPTGHPLSSLLSGIGSITSHQLAGKVGALSGFKQAIEEGFLENLSATVRQEISADDLELATAVLGGDPAGGLAHVPAAVLAGAVLERNLRAKCAAAGAEIYKANGERKQLNALIDEAKRLGLISPLRDSQMRVWARIRNDAAHGDFDKFTRADVQAFVRDLPAALADLT